ncbi:5-formyltetrahydrofolate cyclo-ligase [Ignavigranum ruoffiae]|uniref:5-formyltetrahydrofolate cyclo-ligase n=1 Tax=Ignavigranum ruoffiae TaxID=89093 RepID=A0A1H8ZQZ9_9LACT|nr:5-formyltetrahydrofolate cyclo-ligase [Ignavigranum ruoffiae]SEP66774.1 5-formyltetrahydrofolate cyclo-ligase [Ignavigranum ruoffiae]
MDKNDLRKKMLNQLAEMPLAERQAQEEILYQKLKDQLTQQQVKKLGFYWGRAPEIDTAWMIKELNHLAIEIYLPRVEKQRQLSFRKFMGEDQLVSSKMGIMEPAKEIAEGSVADLDLLIVPGLAYQASGFRLGYGGGYYDRVLLAHPKLATLSLAFDFQLCQQEAWPVEDHDQAVDQLIVARKGEGLHENHK